MEFFGILPEQLLAVAINSATNVTKTVDDLVIEAGRTSCDGIWDFWNFQKQSTDKSEIEEELDPMRTQDSDTDRSEEIEDLSQFNVRPDSF